MMVLLLQGRGALYTVCGAIDSRQQRSFVGLLYRHRSVHVS